MASYPAASFIRFYQNHRLLTVDLRPTWRTVDGGSRTYVEQLMRGFAGRLETGHAVVGVERNGSEARVRTADGGAAGFDHVVLAIHADQALALLDAPTPDEAQLLSTIPFRSNRAVLHRDARLMPKRRAAWAAWNHLGLSGQAGEGGVTYWMNRLQNLDPAHPLFVTLNPIREVAADKTIATIPYEHPLFDSKAVEAQEHLWRLQGNRNTWFAGSYFGHGFHEDALQAGLAAAEAVGGVRRPWDVAGESSRITLSPVLEAAE